MSFEKSQHDAYDQRREPGEKAESGEHERCEDNVPAFKVKLLARFTHGLIGGMLSINFSPLEAVTFAARG